MKNSVKAVLMAAVLALVPAMGNADTVTINFTAGSLFSRPGTMLPKNSTVVVLADEDGDGSFGLDALTSSTWTPDSGDAVIARFASGDSGIADQTLNFAIATTNTSTTIGTGDKLLVMWYETPYSASATGPGAGVYAGAFRTDAVVDGDFGFVIPAAGSAGALLALDSSQGGSTDSASLVGNLRTPTAVPEPASMAVLAVGALALAARRRRA